MFLPLLSLLLALWSAAPPVESAPHLSEWTAYSQRDALKPVFSREGKILTIASSGNSNSNGAWRAHRPVRGGHFYKVGASFSAKEVGLFRRSILVKVDWKDSEGERVGYPDYPLMAGEVPGGTGRFESILEAPSTATQALVELIFRWSPTGSVKWTDVHFEETDPPPVRTVKLATIYHRPSGSSGPQENRQLYEPLLEEAGRRGANFVCLPEGMTIVGTSSAYLEVAEPVPGPTTEFLGKLARKYSMYIVAGLYESAGKTTYNTAVLVGPSGKLEGRYRKVSLPREEVEGGLTPGDEFPVFQTSFGTIGILICWDIQFPEGARRLAAQGAEIIFLPIWGGIEPLFPARAIENQVFLVTSSFDSKTGIWDREGRLLGAASQNGTVVVSEVDLGKPVLWDWLGNLRARIPHEAPAASEVN